MGSNGPLGDEPIEDYLDELMTQLRLPPRAARHLLQETEDHLRTAAEAAERRGIARLAAEHDAVARFGAAQEIAERAHAARRRRPSASAAALAWAITALTGVALTAVGASGIIAGLLWVAVGGRFVGELPSQYPDFLCPVPYVSSPGHALNCGQLAAMGDRQEAILLRLVAGLAGLVLLAGARLTRRYLGLDPSSRRSLATALSVILAVSFSGVALVYFAEAAQLAIRYGSLGVGWKLSAGLVGLAGAVASITRARHHLRYVRPWYDALVET